MSDLDDIKAYIRKAGPTEVSRQTSIGRRTLQYIVNGSGWPSTQTVEKILAVMPPEVVPLPRSAPIGSPTPTAHELGKA